MLRVHEQTPILFLLRPRSGSRLPSAMRPDSQSFDRQICSAPRERKWSGSHEHTGFTMRYHARSRRFRRGIASTRVSSVRLAEIAIENGLATVTSGTFDSLVTHGAQTIRQNLEYTGGGLHVPARFDIGLDFGGDHQHFI